MPIHMQLCIGLFRMGHYGNGASVREAAARFGTSEGHVARCTARVVKALTRLSMSLIPWPGAFRRRQLAKMGEELWGLTGRIGSVDGAQIPLAWAPSVRPRSFFDRKSRRSLNALATVDHDYRAINMATGSLGPAPDSEMQRASSFHARPEEHFSPRERLVRDKGTLMTAEAAPSHKGDAAADPDNANFNRQLASARVRSEQSFGQGKGRFACLKQLRAQIHAMSDVQIAFDWITAALTLRNFCIDFGDGNPPSNEFSHLQGPGLQPTTRQSMRGPEEDARMRLAKRAVWFMRRKGICID